MSAPTDDAPAGWRKIDDYAYQRGTQSICRYVVLGVSEFALFGAGPQMLGHWPTFRKALAAADAALAGEA